MKVSVIIPVLNEEDHLPELIKDINAQTLPTVEIIVVDAFSNDASIARALSLDPNIKVLQIHPNIGRQRYQGGVSASGELLVFLDADTRMSPDFLSKSVQEIEKRNLYIACPKYVPYHLLSGGVVGQSALGIRVIYKLFDWLFFVFQKISPSGAGSCIFVRKETFDAVGGFRDNLKFDDIEFIRRASRYEKFGQIKKSIYVSDRRFVRYGVLRTLCVYIILSILFFFNAFNTSSIVEYGFADYTKKER